MMETFMKMAVAALICAAHVHVVETVVTLPEYQDQVPLQTGAGLSPGYVLVPVHVMPGIIRKLIESKALTTYQKFRNPTSYYIDITVGTPPQPIRALLAIDINGMAVFSTQCEKPECNNHFKYDHEASSTFSVSTGETYEARFADFYTEGPAARDVLRLNSLTIQDHLFEEATEVRESGLFGDTPFEGVIGLSRFNFTRLTSNLTRMSPFLHMIDKHLLPLNAFSLRLPRFQNETGALLLGADISNSIPPGRDSITLPLTSRDSNDPEAHEFLGSGWQTGLHHVRMDAWHDHAGFDYSLVNHTVVFSTEFSFLTLPYAIMDDMRLVLGLEKSDDPLIDCNKRAIMPNVTLRIGVGASIHDVTLTPWQYTTTEGLLWFPPGLCVLPWAQMNSVYQDYIVLGTTFLRDYDTVFNYDRETITCKLAKF